MNLKQEQVDMRVRTSHKKATVLSLLKGTTVSLSEIAEKAGCTRQYVSLITKEKLWVTGKQRQASRAITERALKQETVIDLSAFGKEAKRKGFIVEVSKLHGRLKNPFALVVEGKMVRILQASQRKNTISISPPLVREGYDMFVWVLPDNKFLIVPPNAIPTKPTMFTYPHRKRVPRADWHKYIDAWHLLQSESLESEERKTYEETLRNRLMNKANLRVPVLSSRYVEHGRRQIEKIRLKMKMLEPRLAYLTARRAEVEASMRTLLAKEVRWTVLCKALTIPIVEGESQ